MTGKLLTGCLILGLLAVAVAATALLFLRERRKAARLDRLCEEAERYAAELMETGWEEIRPKEGDGHGR